jgi:hypothetical protein
MKELYIYVFSMIHLTVDTWDYDVFRQNEDTSSIITSDINS